MKKALVGILLVGAQMLLGAAMAAGSIGIADIKDGAEFSADTVDMGFGPPIMLPAGKKWQVIKRSEFLGYKKKWRMVRFTLLNASDADALQMVSVATNLTREMVGAAGQDKCIKIPGTLTQNYRNLTSNVFGCSAFLAFPDLKTTLPDLLATTVEERSMGLLSGLLKPLASNPCGGQVISDTSIGCCFADSRSKALGDKFPSVECSRVQL